MNLLDISKAKEIIEGFSRARVMVIGDLILDHFIWGRVERISPEAPVPVVEVTSESVMLGGAANVANNISSLNGKVLIAGVVGKDDAGGQVRRLLMSKGIDIDGIVCDSKRPTSVKTRVVAHNQQVVRFDREKRDYIDDGVIEDILKWAKEKVKEVDIVIISDYAKGVINKKLVSSLVEFAKEAGRMIVVDPKVKHFPYYKGVTLITPNTIEASKASGIEIVDLPSLEKAGRWLLKEALCESILITRGEHGMALFERNGNPVHIPTVAKEVYDVTGAGDTVVAALALALASGAAFREAACLANYAAGIVVGEVGTATVSRRELLNVVVNGGII